MYLRVRRVTGASESAIFAMLWFCWVFDSVVHGFAERENFWVVRVCVGFAPP